MGKKILVAEDDPGIRDILEIIFEGQGYELELKERGDDLFSNRYVKPDLFVLDKQLSGCSGLDVCRFLKNNPETCNIPVIMLSASPDIGVLSKQAGANDHMTKPFNIADLLTLVGKYV